MPKDLRIDPSNQTFSDPRSKLMAQNTTELLNKLLAGYDNRLRPGFGGRFISYFQSEVESLHVVIIMVGLPGKS